MNYPGCNHLELPEFAGANAHTPYLADPDDEAASEAMRLARGGDQALRPDRTGWSSRFITPSARATKC